MKNPERGTKFLEKREGFFEKNAVIFSSLLKRLAIGLFILIGLGSIAGTTISFFTADHQKNNANTTPAVVHQKDQSVLATATQKLVSTISFHIPAVFYEPVTFKKNFFSEGTATFNGKSVFNNDVQMTNHNLDLGTGQLTASNVVYGITPGPGITVSPGQTPTVTNTGVLSVQGQTGAVQLAQGNGISVNGLQITNTGVTAVQGQTGSVAFTAGSGIAINGTTISSTNSQTGNAFGTVTSGGTSFSAGTPSDTMTFTAGSGMTITPDAANKTLTFASTGGSGLSGLTTNGVLYATGSNTATSLTPGTSGFVLQSNGAGSPPSWVVNSGTSPSFSAITSGTNTTAAMIVGSGASLDFTGTGTINASSVTGLTIASGKTFTVNNTLTFAGTDGTSFTLPATSDTLVGRNSTDTLTNKTIAAGSNTITGLTNANLSGAAGITNANLANSSVTVTAGTGLSGGGAVSLGSSVTLNNAGVLSAIGTTNQVNVSAATGNVTFSLPQNIDTGASPTFAGATLSNFTGNNAVLYATAGTGSVTAAATNTMDLCLTSGASAPTWASCSGGSATNYWNIASGTIAPINSTLDLLIGGAASNSAKFAVLNVSSGTPAASVSAGTNGGAYLSATGTIATTAKQSLTLGDANTGNIILNGFSTGLIHSNSSGVLSSSAVNLNSADVIGQLPLANGGTNANLSAVQGGIVYSGASAMAISAAGTSGQCLISGGTGTPTWGTCTTGGGTNLWTTTNGAIYPINATEDLFVGGNATASAKFAVLNVNNGTPTASVSAGINGGAYVTADGTLATTANQTLMLGGSTTGNITLAPLNGNGTVTSTGDMNLSSGKVYEINGTSVLSNNTLGTGVTVSSLTSVGTLTSGTWNATVIGSQYGGTGQNFSGATGVPSILSGSWSVAATLATSLGGLGANVTAASAGELLYSTSTTAYGHLAAGSSNQCLLSGGVGAPSWGACALGTNYWQLSGSTISPATQTNGFAVGTTTRLAGTDLRSLSGTQATASISGATSFASLVVDNSGTGDIFAASSSGLPRFIIGQTGTLTASAYGTGIAHFSSTGVVSSSAINLNSADVTSTLPVGNGGTGTTSFTTNGILYGNGSSAIQVTAQGGAGTVLHGNGGVPTFSAVSLTADVTGQLPLANGGTNANLTADNGGIVYSSGTALAILAHSGSTNQCLLSGGAGAPSWGACALGANYWQLNSGVISPLTQTNTLSIGATTSLATLDVRSLNGTQATASISGKTSLAGLVIDNSGVGDIFTASSSGLNRFVINQNGNVGIGTTTAGAALDVNGNLLLGANSTIDIRSSGTLTIGNGANTSGLTLGKSGATTTFNSTSWTATPTISGLVTANGGVTVASGQNLTLAGITGNNAVLYVTATTGVVTSTTTSSANQCLLSGAGNAPSWGACALGTNYWQLNGSTISPATQTNGLAIGTTTGLGALDVRSLNGTQPTASISGTTSFAGLVVDNSGSGDIFTASSSGLNRFVINQNGNVGIGTTATSNFLLTVNGGIGPVSSGVAHLGTTTNYWGDFIGNFAKLQTGLALGSFNPSEGGVGANGLGGGTSPIATISANTSYAAFVVDNKGVGDLFTASSSGLNRFVISQNGNVGIGTTTPGGLLTLNGTASNTALLGATVGSASNALINLAPSSDGIVRFGFRIDSSNTNGSSNNLNLDYRQVGTGTPITALTVQRTNGFIGINNTNPLGTLDVKSSSGTSPSASISGSTSFASLVVDNSGIGDLFTASSSGLNRFVINQNGNVGIGTTTPGAALDVNGNLLLGANSTIDTRASGTLTIGNGANTTGLTLGKSGATTTFNSTSWTATPTISGLITANGGLNVASGQNLTLAGITGNNAVLYATAGTGVVTSAVTSSANQCLLSGAGNAPAWGSCGGTNYWQLTGSVISQATLTNTVTIGATTSLGTFDVRNLNGTLATASVSGKTSFAALTVDNSGKGDLFAASSSGLNRFVITQNGNVGIGTTNPSDLLHVLKNDGTDLNATFENDSSGKGAYVLTHANSNYSGLEIEGTGQQWNVGTNGDTNFDLVDATNNTTPLTVETGAPNNSLYINGSGNVGIGTSSPVSKLDVEGGNVMIGQQTNTSVSADQTWTKVSQATAGTIASGDSFNIASISASTVYNGSLYVGTYGTATGSAEVYRYNGSGSSWTKVSQPTPGKIASGGTANIASVSAMVVYNGQLYIGTSKSNAAEIYRYEGGTTWTVMNSTAGTFNSTSAIDGVSAMAVYNGQLYFGTSETKKAEVYINDGIANNFGAITAAGTIGSTTSMDKVTAMTVFNNFLWVAASKGATGAELYKWQSRQNTFQPIASTGSFHDSVSGGNITSVAAVTAMVTYRGVLYLGIRAPSSAYLLRYDETGYSDAITLNDFSGENNSAGSIDGGTTGILSVSALAVYNDRLFIGTEKTGAAEIYRYEYGEDGSSVWTRVSQTTPGTISAGGTSGIHMISAMIPYNGSLFAGTYKPGAAEMYQFTDISNQSYALQFHAGATQGGGEQNNLLNVGSISFVASPSASVTGAGSTGSFLFSNSIVTQTGAYDYAEDYPTRDDSLSAGDIVALDPSESDMVKTATQGDSLVGVYSTNPGFELSQADTTINGGRAIPVALTGRVPMKVSTESGAINIGDLLTTSSQPGVAMKATKPGFIIGKAMEPYTGEGVGSIMTYVNVTWADPGVQLTASGDLNIASTLPAVIPSFAAPAILGDSTATASASVSATMTDPLSQLGASVSLLQTQYASLSANMTKLNQLDDLSQRITALEKNMPLVAASASGDFLSTDATISGQLSVTGRTLLSDVGITGKVSMGLLTIDGMGSDSASPAAEINTLSGPLKFQSLALNGIDFENGKITIDTDGNFSTQGTVTAKKYMVYTSDQQNASIGEATLPEGKTTVDVETTAVTSLSKIFVTAESVIAEPLTVTKKANGKSFTVQIATPAKRDVKFNWWIVN